MNKLILPLLGAVGAYYIYKKYSENQAKTTEANAAEEDAALGGGAGGGGAAAAPATEAPMETPASSTETPAVAPVSVEAPKVVKTMKLGVKPTSEGTGIRVASKPNRQANVRLGGKPPMNMGLSRTRIVSTNPRDRYAGYMDFDSNPDVFGDMM